jgi:hypothetical protein
VVETWLASRGMQTPTGQPHLRAWAPTTPAPCSPRRRPDTPLEHPAVGWLSEITDLVLLHIGTWDTPDQRNIVRHLACELPRSTVVELPEVGRIPTLEAPAKVTAEVLTFLRGMP